MSNEIKVGDKVRVREDAPKILRKTILSKVFDEESKVVAIDSEMALIWTEPIHKNLIPTKYLVKVDAEAKNESKPQFKIGDRVKIKEGRGLQNEGVHGVITDYYAPNGTFRVEMPNWVHPDHLVHLSDEEFDNSRYDKDAIRIPSEPEKPSEEIKVGDRVEELVSRKSGRVLGIEGDFVVVGTPYDKEKHYWHIDSVELIEPTEQTEAEKSFEDQLRDVLNGVEHQDYGHPIQAAMINLDINDWDAYTADLAKEIALKVANKYNDPEEAAEYAVSVAKAVVEELKRK